jgi:outer membrane protein assembly factor BamE (lipoprotein component of BamABCDE complex)
MRACLLATVIFSAPACVTQGNYFPSDTAWIKPSQTRQQDVRSLLGDPHMVGNSGGTPTWTYGYYRYKLVGVSSTKELKLYWNPDQTVRNFSFNSSFPEDVRGERRSPPPKPLSQVERP